MLTVSWTLAEGRRLIETNPASLFISYPDLANITTMLKITALLLAASLPSLAASFNTGVGFPSAPESAAGCRHARSDGYTLVCSASLSGAEGLSVVDMWRDSSGWVVSGMVANTIPTSSTTTVNTSVSATLDKELADIWGNLVITDRCNPDSKDCQPVTVTANGQQIGILEGGDSLVTQGPAVIQLSSTQLMTHPGDDYVGYFDVLISAQ
jgi:hypothetical protein